MSSWETGERREAQGDLNCTGQSRGPRPLFLHSHVGLVVLPNLLDAHIILGVNEGLSSGIRLGQCYDAGDVLEVMLVFHLDLWAGWGSGPWQDGAAVGVPQGGGVHTSGTGELSTQKIRWTYIPRHLVHA